MNEVQSFCKRHSACPAGTRWASAYTSLADVYDNCVRGDWLAWMLVRASKIDRLAAASLACKLAERVLPRFEDLYPKDARPRAAIKAARAWADKPTTENRLTAELAMDRANDAASMAYDAAGRAYGAVPPRVDRYGAAYAAANAAYAAADAAAAACVIGAVATAAMNAAHAIERNTRGTRAVELRTQADIIRKLVPNPWRVKK